MRFFLLFMMIVTLVQYLFVLPTQRVERRADRYAEQASAGVAEELQKTVFKQKRAAYLDSMSNEEILSIPLLKDFTYQELKGQQLALGLDLKGGMSVVLQVDLRNFVQALAGNSQDATFLEALDKATEAQKSAQSDYISLFASAWRETSNGADLAPLFARNESLRDEITFDTPNGEVVRILREKADETVDRTFELLKERIDKLGVAQPNVSLDASRDLILVELPGIDNPERARTYLQAAAKLEFWDVYQISDQGVLDAFVQANERLAKQRKGPEAEPDYEVVPVYATDSLGNVDSSAVERYDTIRNQLDLNQGPLFEIFTLNSSGQFGLAAMGTAAGNQMDQVDTLLSQPDIQSLFPRDMRFRWSRDPVQNFETGEETDAYTLYAIKLPRGGREEAPLTGESVIDASPQPDPTGEITVTLRMNNSGAKTWGQMTERAALDNNRQIAILLDDEVVSAPSVQNPIMNGNTSITGNFDIQEARDLANILQVGKLPAETRIIQSALVGPSLGQENINRSINALVIGFALVLAFMIFYYGGAGIVSIIALLLNLFFIFGVLASIGTVLTLPGVAGIVLTIGMAVDANVIIFERIREELREGKGLAMAIQDGFKNSSSAIIDANVTTILTAIVLFYFGLGPIKGFAVVLIIGVLSSFFTAVMVGRLIFEWWTDKGRHVTFSTAPTKNALSNLNIDWLGKRRIAYVISGSLLLLGIISFVARGFELGVDFKGGYSYNVTFEQGMDVSAPDLRDALTTAFDGSVPIVKAVNTANTYNVVTDYLVDDTAEDAAERVMAALHQGVSQVVGGDLSLKNFSDPDGEGTHVASSTKVGPTIADDIRKSSVYATIFALLTIFLYIFIRFSRWEYSAGAVAALFHDTLIVLAAFSLLHGVLPFSLEIDQAFIAAILTVIGYSINDTVVVFDRIREYMNHYTKKSKKDVINLAINSTLSRTVITSLTTLLVVGILFFFGGTSIRGFAFALLIGIIVGTYSSIFVATPIMADLSGERKPKSSAGESGKKTFSRAAQKAMR